MVCWHQTMKNRVFDSRSESQEHSIFRHLIYDVMGVTTTPHYNQ